jgi:rare lipoprotein A
MTVSSVFFCVVWVAVAGCASAPRFTKAREAEGARAGSPSSSREEGTAVYYAAKFQGRKTASGERFDKDKFTAAHRTLPFGTMVRVTNLDNDRSVVVRINDRGPFGSSGHIIDLSTAAAQAIGLGRQGVARVKLEIER